MSPLGGPGISHLLVFIQSSVQFDRNAMDSLEFVGFDVPVRALFDEAENLTTLRQIISQ